MNSPSAPHHELLDDELDDFIEEADLVAANATIEQSGLWPEHVPVPQSSLGKAKFILGSAFSAQVAKGSIRRIEKGSSDSAMLEVLPGRLRLTTCCGALTCRATIPLDPAKMAVPSGGLRFTVDLRVLQGIEKHHRDNRPLLCSVDLAQKQFTISTDRTGKRGRRHCIEALPAPSAHIFERETSKPQDTAAVRGDVLSRVLQLCRSASNPRATGSFSVVTIEDGMARGGSESVVMVAREPALGDLRLSVPVRHCGHVAQIAKNMQSDVEVVQTETHILLRDTIVELAILKSSDRFPPIDALARIVAQVSAFIDLERFHTEVWHADFQRHFNRYFSRRRASTTSQGNTTVKSRKNLVELQRTESELGLIIQGPEWIGRFYIPDVHFELATAATGYKPMLQEGEESATGRERTRDDPEVWGKIDCYRLERVCLAFRPYQTATLRHCAKLMMIEVNDPRCRATAYFAYVETADERFERSI